MAFAGDLLRTTRSRRTDGGALGARGLPLGRGEAAALFAAVLLFRKSHCSGEQ